MVLVSEPLNEPVVVLSKEEASGQGSAAAVVGEVLRAIEPLLEVVRLPSCFRLLPDGRLEGLDMESPNQRIVY